MNDPWAQAMFKRCRHISIFSISQDYFELQKRTNGANGTKPNNFRDVLKNYQDETSMDITLNGFKFLTSTCYNEIYQPLTIDMT